MTNHAPIAYAYDAAIHCPDCALARFGRCQHGSMADNCVYCEITDSEGNSVHPVFSWDERQPEGEGCDDCHEWIYVPFYSQCGQDYTDAGGGMSSDCDCTSARVDLYAAMRREGF